MPTVRAAARKPRLRPRAIPALFVLGATLGTAWDLLHTSSGTLTYSHPTFGDEAWWVPLEFGLAYALGAPLIAMLGDPAPRRDAVRVALGETAWLTALYSATAFLHEQPWALVAALTLALAARASTFGVLVAANPIPAVAIVVLGPLTESALVAAGLFRYAEPQLGNIPIWLPLLWANAIPFAVRLTEAALLLGGVRVPATGEPASGRAAPPRPA